MKTSDLTKILGKLREINKNIWIIYTKWLKNARWGSSFLVKFHASRYNYFKCFA